MVKHLTTGMRIFRLVLHCLSLFSMATCLCIFLAILIGQDRVQSTLAFTSDRTGTNQIYILDSATGNVIQTTHDTFNNFQPVWGTNWSLIYVSYPVPLHISVVDITNGQIKPLDAGVGHDEYQPDWLSERELAIVTNPDMNWDIALYGGTRNYYPDTLNSPYNEIEPCWWTNKHLSFVSDRTGNYDIYLYDISNEILTNLTDNPANDYNPACSTDGRLAFTSTRDFNAEVYVMDLETRVAQNVTRNSSSDFNPAWLSDGQLSFVSERDGNREIYVLNVDTGQLSNITRNAANDDQPAWSRN